jgi:hypothetical protein
MSREAEKIRFLQSTLLELDKVDYLDKIIGHADKIVKCDWIANFA